MDDMLNSAKRGVSFHMPGHKGRMPSVDMSLDTTELPQTDDLFSPASGILKAQEALCRSTGANASILLCNGATSGVTTMLLMCAREGEGVILSRTAHVSAISALAISGAEPVWVEDAPEAYIAAIRESNAHAVFMTRPDYYGRAMDISQVIAEAHARNMAVLVDEAHGAHFNWWSVITPAMRLGADMCVQSAHKTLPAMTGGAWLLLKDAGAYERALSMLRLTASSSPSFIIMRSLDMARAWMDEHGREALDKLVDMSLIARAEIGIIDGVRVEPNDDITRLTIDVSARGVSGYNAYEHMRESGVTLEMADAARIVGISSVMNTREDFSALVTAVKSLPCGEYIQPPPFSYATPTRAMSIREASFADVECLPLADAAGRVCARAMGLYPPGRAVFMPGEVMDETTLNALIARLDMGANAFGLIRGMIAVVK